MHAVSTNQIADILHYNDNNGYGSINNLREKTIAEQITGD